MNLLEANIGLKSVIRLLGKRKTRKILKKLGLDSGIEIEKLKPVNLDAPVMFRLLGMNFCITRALATCIEVENID